MRAFATLLLTILLTPVGLHAESTRIAGADTIDQCGLGWEVTKQHTFLGTTIRGTTNAFVPPTFGMTTGTIGCQKHSISKNEDAAVMFAMANTESLVVDMAQGHGEYVEGLAQTMGCTNTAIFAKMTQVNYSEIVGSDVTGVQLYKNIKRQIALDPALAVSCGV